MSRIAFAAATIVLLSTSPVASQQRTAPEVIGTKCVSNNGATVCPVAIPNALPGYSFYALRSPAGTSNCVRQVETWATANGINPDKILQITSTGRTDCLFNWRQ